MKKFILVLAAMAISGTAVAGPSWTYGQLDYSRADSGNDDSEGFRVMGSFGFADKWHVQAAYYDGEIDGGKGSSGGDDIDGYRVVGGIHPAITENTDFVFELSLFDGDVDDGSTTDEEVDGYGFGTGVRSQITENMELHGSVWAISGDRDSGSSSQDFTEIVFVGGGQYLFTENLGLTLELTLDDPIYGGDSANFGVRFTF